MKRLKAFSMAIAMGLVTAKPLLSLPSPEDKPEEVLRTEIITGARSPIDGKPMTAADYAQLQTDIATGPPPRPEVSKKLRRTVNLLRLRKFIKTFFPFLPVK